MNPRSLPTASHQNQERPPADKVLMANLSSLARPLVRWAVSHGIGHVLVSRWLKPIFLQEAHRALRQQGQGTTDSALALAAGLHRGDIQQLLVQPLDTTATEPAIPVTHQVLANWLIGQLPSTIPFKADAEATGAARSFTDLVQCTPKAASHGFSAKLILQDMQRQGLVSAAANQVTLLAFGATANSGQAHAMQHIGRAVHDLLSAGLHNLKADESNQFLEQSLQADGLYPASVDRLHQLATEQWTQVLQALLPQAKALSDQDEPQGGTHRMRVGVYFYAEPMQGMDPSPANPPSRARGNPSTSPESVEPPNKRQS